MKKELQPERGQGGALAKQEFEGHPAESVKLEKRKGKKERKIRTAYTVNPSRSYTARLFLKHGGPMRAE